MKKTTIIFTAILLFSIMAPSIVTADEDIHELTIEIEGEGFEFVYGEGTHEFMEGDEVELIARPYDEHVFTEWKGDYESEEDSINFTIKRDMTLTAVFEPVFGIDHPEEEDVIEGRDIEVEWTIRTEEYSHVEVRLDENDSWQSVGDRSAWMFYDTDEGNHTVEARLMDGRREISRDKAEIEFERVDWYDTMPVWEMLILVVTVSMLCGIDRLFKGIDIGRKTKKKIEEWRDRR